MISSPSSSAGKTTVTCAILSIFASKFGSDKIASFKVGPDFIDVLFHEKILGFSQKESSHSGNIDLYFTDESSAKKWFSRISSTCRIAIIEGAMGYFDGAGGKDEASSWAVAKTLQTSTILVLNASGAFLSICATINGFLHFREKNGDNSKIAGVILNRCSEKIFDSLSKTIQKECGVDVLGFLPKDARFEIKSRHLGLFTPADVFDLEQKISLLSETAKKTLNIEKILKIADNAKKIDCLPKTKIEFPQKVKIAVANDRAFCFYYRENLELLRENGAKIEFFSPLLDEKIPNGSGALYIGGGYPELFESELSSSKKCADSILAFAKRGAPILAECGGFLYLQLLGILKGTFYNTKRLVRFGYAELTANEDTFLCKKGEKIRAHEFHYFETSENGSAFVAKKSDGREWNCVQSEKNILAGFPHFSFASNPTFAQNFVRAALSFESLKGFY